LFTNICIVCVTVQEMAYAASTGKDLFYVFLQIS